MLTLLENTGVSLKTCRFQLLRKSLDYLGHMLLSGLIAISEDSTSAIDYAKLRQDMAQLRFFLGSCNVYRRFIKCFSQMSKHLNRRKQNDVKPTWDDPPFKQNRHFRRLSTDWLDPRVGTTCGEQIIPSQRGLLRLPDRHDAPSATRLWKSDNFCDDWLFFSVFNRIGATVYGFRTRMRRGGVVHPNAVSTDRGNKFYQPFGSQRASLADE